MKKLVFLSSLFALSQSLYAQDHADKYNVSVFANYRDIKPEKGAANSSAAVQKIKTSFPGWYVQTDKWTGSIKDITGAPAAVSGATLEDKARYCMDNYLGVNDAEWELTGTATNKKGFTYLYFTQSIDGHRVTFSKMTFRFTADSKLARVTMKGYGTADTKLKPAVTTADVLATATADLGGISITAQSVNDNWEWFPIPSSKGFTLHPAYSFSVAGKTQNQSDVPLALTGYVDAVTGALLYRDNETKEAIDLTVKGTVYKDGTASPATDEPLADLMITVGATNYYTSALGFLSFPTLSSPTTATVKLQGRWSKVNDVPSSTTPSTTTTISTGSTLLYPTSATATSRHINAYYHTTRVHDYMKEKFATFTAMDSPLPTNVDVTGTCNAFYSGFTINFYTAGSGCNSFAEIGDIIYHEYGHGISDRFYSTYGPSSMRNGALNEGCSDVWGMSISKNPILGQNAYTTGGYIRRYDLAPKVYPKDIMGEVHADGEIIAGAWWDYGVNKASVDSMGELFALTYYDVPDGPNGTEGDVYHEVLMSALVNDDNDGILSNGTPNFDKIVAAFARHGIYLLSDAAINHTEVAHQPAGTPVTVNAKLTLTNPDFFQNLNLIYRVRGGSWDTLKMTDAGGLNFNATIPAQTEGTILDYYFSVEDLLNNNGVFFPDAYNPTVAAVQTSIPYQFGIGLAAGLTVDFETPLSGWQVGGVTGDAATTGIWIQAAPVASFTSASSGSMPVQPGVDNTPGSGTQCLVTGNASTVTASMNTACVKNGMTSVLTPIFDLTGYVNPVIEYYRWFSNDRGNYKRKDNWQVTLRDSASSLWSSVDNTFQSDYNWRRRVFTLKQYLPTSSKKIQMKFIAKNAASPGLSTVEGAVDDFIIYEGSPSAVSIGATPKVQIANIFPNPADDQLTIQLSAAGKGSISFYDMTGRTVSNIDMDGSNTLYNIGTKMLPAGQYMLVIRTEGVIQTKHITLKH